MTVELRPLGVACNIGCLYCYQNPVRDATNINTSYDVEKMIGEVERVGHKFSMFGGEALLVPKEDLEKFWKYGYDKFKENSIQTNAILIDDDHIELFKKYNVSVGISIDGPSDLNDLRSAGTLTKTREATVKIQDNIRKLVREKVPCSVIITIHKLNGSRENLPRLLSFIDWLGETGVKSGNIHTLEVDDPLTAQRFCLTEEENARVFLEIAKFLEVRPNLHWNPFYEIKDILRGDVKNSLCIWNKCDPLNTSAVYGIEGDGTLTNCTRTNKDGIELYKSDGHGYERYIALYYTPDEYGGCKGCRFWSTCSGSCPGESANRDWRNKTIHCHTMKTILSYYEGLLERERTTPISKHPRLKEIEEVLLKHFTSGENISLTKATKLVENSPEVIRVYKEGKRML